MGVSRSLEMHKLQNDGMYLITYASNEESNQRSLISKTRLSKYIENFTTKNWKFSDK